MSTSASFYDILGYFFALISYTITGLGIIFLNFFSGLGGCKRIWYCWVFRLFISRYVGGWVGWHLFLLLLKNGMEGNDGREDNNENMKRKKTTRDYESVGGGVEQCAYL